MKRFGIILAALFAGQTALAGFQVNNSSSKNLGFASIYQCGAGLTCTMGTKASGPSVTVTVSGGAGSFTTLSSSGTYSPNGGLTDYDTTANMTTFSTWNPGAATNATSATPAATSVYMTQIFIPHNVTLTGIGYLNAATVGTNNVIVALFDDTGAPLANSALAGTLTSGASAFQKVAFTATKAVKGPGTYWIGLYYNGTTDRYYAVPTIGQSNGLAGSVGTQTFGTVAAVTLPTTFTAGAGPVAYVY